MENDPEYGPYTSFNDAKKGVSGVPRKEDAAAKPCRKGQSKEWQNPERVCMHGREQNHSSVIHHILE